MVNEEIKKDDDKPRFTIERGRGGVCVKHLSTKTRGLGVCFSSVKNLAKGVCVWGNAPTLLEKSGRRKKKIDENLPLENCAVSKIMRASKY